MRILSGKLLFAFGVFSMPLWFQAPSHAASPVMGASLATGDGVHWVGSWACAPQLVEPSNLPPAPLASSTLRQFIHTSIGGTRIRLLFSNAFGTNSVQIKAAHVALAAGPGAGPSANAEIQPASDTTLLFRGLRSVEIHPGETLCSDPVAFNLPPLTNLAVTIQYGDISGRVITGHPGSRTTSFIIDGDAVSAATMTGATKTSHWYTLTGLDVVAEKGGGALVVLGDSITDGRGSTTDGNNRWPDNLAKRLQAYAPTTGVGVLNLGIGGNGMFGGLGPAALTRFDRDVLDQSGVRWLIVFEGVNDIGTSRSERASTMATNLMWAFQRLIEKAHSRHIRVYGATISPFGGNRYFSPVHESTRQTVNTWIRTNHQFDAVIDFDAVVRNPSATTNLLSTFDTGDGLHLNPKGYAAMADAIDLELFTQ